MPTGYCHNHALPVPVLAPEDALVPLAIASDAGTERCTLLACVDDRRLPLTLFVVEDGEASADEALLALGVLLDAVRGGSALAAVVIASSRPGSECRPTARDGDAYAEADARCAAEGIVLLDWFVLADGATASIGDATARPPRW